MSDPEGVSLREHIERILHEQDRALQALAVSTAREVATLAESTEREVQTLAATHAREVAELKHNVEELARIHSEAHAREHALSQNAVEKAEQSLMLRLEGMNELRAQIASERGKYIDRDMLDTRVSALDSAIDILSTTLRADYTRAWELATSERQKLADRINMLERAQANLDGRFLVLGGVLAFALVVVEFVARTIIK